MPVSSNWKGCNPAKVVMLVRVHPQAPFYGLIPEHGVIENANSDWKG